MCLHQKLTLTLRRDFSCIPSNGNKTDMTFPLLICPFFISPIPSFDFLSSPWFSTPPPFFYWYVVICRDDDLLISAGGMFDKQAAAGTHSGCNLTCSVISSWVITLWLWLWHCRATGRGWLMVLFNFILCFFIVEYLRYYSMASM